MGRLIDVRLEWRRIGEGGSEVAKEIRHRNDRDKEECADGGGRVFASVLCAIRDGEMSDPREARERESKAE